MSTHFYPGPSNIFNFSWIKCARSRLQVRENMYLFTKHQLYSQTSCFYLHVFEIIHDKNIAATCLPTKLALKIMIMNGSFLPNSQKQAINSTPTSTFPGLTASWSCLTWRLPSLKWRTAMLLMFFKQGALIWQSWRLGSWSRCFCSYCERWPWMVALFLQLLVKKGRISWINHWISYRPSCGAKRDRSRSNSPEQVGQNLVDPNICEYLIRNLFD